MSTHFPHHMEFAQDLNLAQCRALWRFKPQHMSGSAAQADGVQNRFEEGFRPGHSDGLYLARFHHKCPAPSFSDFLPTRSMLTIIAGDIGEGLQYIDQAAQDYLMSRPNPIPNTRHHTRPRLHICITASRAGYSRARLVHGIQHLELIRAALPIQSDSWTSPRGRK